MSPYRTSVPAVKHEEVVVSGGPLHGKTLQFSSTQRITLPFALHGQVGFYRGGVWVPLQG